jgi:hypothetical protein
LVITVDLKDRQENVEPFIESKIRGRLYLHSEISDRGTNSMGQFFLFNHVDPLNHLIIEIKSCNDFMKLPPR